MVLGIAFQKGMLPFSLTDLEKAFASSVPKAELVLNWEAFHLGREWVISGSAPVVKTASLERLERSVSLAAYPWQIKDRMLRLTSHDLSRENGS